MNLLHQRIHARCCSGGRHNYDAIAERYDFEFGNIFKAYIVRVNYNVYSLLHHEIINSRLIYARAPVKQLSIPVLKISSILHNVSQIIHHCFRVDIINREKKNIYHPYRFQSHVKY